MARSERGILRKGSWSEEEDILLRKCVEKYGEGKWHLIPLKAGLRRCRKSCRLRWLNYLRPSIKRGSFEADETDLIVRLHNLLGNRWSLIAGRIPGRTANDIKNFWNSHLRKKQVLPTEKYENVNSCSVIRTKVIRPRPVTPSPNSKWFRELRESTEAQKIITTTHQPPSPPPPILWEKNPDKWWNDMLITEDNNKSDTLNTEVYGEDETMVTSDRDEKQLLNEIHENAIIPIDEWGDLVLGDDIWNIFENDVWTS